MQKNSKRITSNLQFKNSSYYGIPKLTQFFYTLLAFILVAGFAIWWFQPDHVPSNFPGNWRILDLLLFILVSFIIWHPIIMDVLTWAIASNIKDIRSHKPVPGLKVAFITTIVPSSESLDLLHKCLPAMMKASYTHDTWLLDEGNHPEVRDICRQYGVLHFSRNGKTQFNTKTGKYTRTKGGNHNSWYEAYGNSYDFVAQIDTDFVPKSTFLTKTLGYFRDPKVAFVGTPQIYGNIQNSIIAKGAAEQLYTFYGSVLKGLSSMKMTLLIGANHVIRVAALKNVNHYSGHITEDLITGMKLHANGWKSVYISEPLAIGEGPSTWEDYFSQQMRWAYGCMDILFKHSPRLFWKMRIRSAIYYFFLQQHYFSGLAMALSILLLCLYFFAGLRAADIDLYRFFGFYSLILLTCWLMSVWLQRFNVERKQEGEMLLAGKIISTAVWPVFLLAFLSLVTGKRLSYKVTPKGNSDVKPRAPMNIFIPHFFMGTIVLLAFASSLFTGRQNAGMMFWAVTSGVLLLSVPFTQDLADIFSTLQKRILKLIRKLYRMNRILQAKTTIELFKPQATMSHPKDSPEQTRIYAGDMFFLLFIVVFSLAPYITQIGFYSDDWSFLGNFSVSKEQSLWGLFQTATTPNTMMRPIQNFYDALLYWTFGLQPLGYQLVNAVTLVLISVLFYVLLRKLKTPRVIAIAIPLVYALLPNYSTDRFWFAVHQANLSIMFYLFSLYSALQATTIQVRRKTYWRVMTIVTLICSALSYEVILPLYLITLCILWNPKKRLGIIYTKKFKSLESTIFISVISISLIYLFLFKAITTKRLSDGVNPEFILHVIVSAFKVNYWTWGINLPQIWGQIISQYTNPLLLILSLILYMVVFWYLHFILAKDRSHFPTSLWMRNLIFLSFIIFLLGYMIFFTNNQVGFSATGLENRVAIAASIGVAMTFVGSIGYITRILLPEKAARFVFCVLIALLSAGSFLAVNTIATFWIEAHQKNQLVLGAVYEQIPEMPKNTTILLDGVCPYVGPAPVFEADWDVKGALQTHYVDPTIKADIITPRITIQNDAIVATIYTFTTEYPYKNLYIYNYTMKAIFPIANSDEAYAYFNEYNHDFNNGCPSASAGHGVSIFY